MVIIVLTHNHQKKTGDSSSQVNQFSADRIPGDAFKVTSCIRLDDKLVRVTLWKHVILLKTQIHPFSNVMLQLQPTGPH